MVTGNNINPQYQEEDATTEGGLKKNAFVSIQRQLAEGPEQLS